MPNIKDLGPFNSYLHLLPIPGSGAPVEWSTLNSITRNIDLVEEHDYFASFVKMYRYEIINSQGALCSTLSSSITNMILKKNGFKRIVLDLCKEYELLLGRIALDDIDIGNMFDFIRDFFQVGHDTRIIIPCFLARLHLFKKDDNLTDAKDVIRNNRDVLEMLYGNEEFENYSQEISLAIDRILSI